MSWSAVELCRKVLPMTNCAECGLPTCLAFATKVVQEKRPLAECPHLEAARTAEVQLELDAQHETGVLLKRNLREDALAWARQRASSMHIEDLPERIGGRVEQRDGGAVLVLPYFDGRRHLAA